MAGQDSGEKTEEATPRRRQEARRKGTVARSIDVNGALALLAIALVAPPALSAFGEAMVAGFRQSLARPPQDVTSGELARFAIPLVGPPLLALGVLLAVAMAVGLVANFGQVGFVLSAEPMKPTLDKINPINGFKRLFGRRAVFDAGKTVLKFTVFGGLAYGAIRAEWHEIPGWAALPPLMAIGAAGDLMHTITLRIAVAWLFLAALDYGFTWLETNKQLRMSKDEVKREFKEQEGAPELKMAQQQRRQKLKRTRVSEAIRSATLVVTNPTHFAVAIQYDRSKHKAPIVVAKGQDYLAAKIRDLAGEHRVPVVSNPPLARALYKQCEVGDFVPHDLFVAVAEVLAYVHRTIKRLRV